MSWVESMCKSVNPDVVVIDMGDKFARMQVMLDLMKHSRQMQYMQDRLQNNMIVLYSICHNSMQKQRVGRDLIRQ